MCAAAATANAAHAKPVKTLVGSNFVVEGNTDIVFLSCVPLHAKARFVVRECYLTCAVITAAGLFFDTRKARGTSTHAAPAHTSDTACLPEVQPYSGFCRNRARGGW